MNRCTISKSDVSRFEKLIGYGFKDKSLVPLALTHRSFANEHKWVGKKFNERLEFLGDAVLGLVVSDYLYAHEMRFSEGHLSHLRSYLVDSSSCNRYIKKLGIEHFLCVGKGESGNQGRGRDSLLSDLFEALIGAIYLDQGLDMAKIFFLKHFKDDIDEMILNPERNWKAELQQYSQKKHYGLPKYTLKKEEGLEHEKKFFVEVFIGNLFSAEGIGSSKKAAEVNAARHLILEFEKER